MSADRWSLRRSSSDWEIGWVVFPPDDIANTEADPLRERYFSRMHHDHTTGTTRLGYRFFYEPLGYRMAIRALDVVRREVRP